MAKKVVITDRYCSDILLMKNVPLGLKRSLLKLFQNQQSLFIFTIRLESPPAPTAGISRRAKQAIKII